MYERCGREAGRSHAAQQRIDGRHELFEHRLLCGAEPHFGVEAPAVGHRDRVTTGRAVDPNPQPAWLLIQCRAPIDGCDRRQVNLADPSW